MKKRIQLLNNISSVIYNELPGERYEVGKEIEDPNWHHRPQCGLPEYGIQ